MAPLLLDRRSLIKAGFYLCLLFVIVFSAGYYSGFTKGYDRAESRFLQQASPVALILPDPEYTDADAFEPKPPAVTEPGAEIDVDRADEAIADAVLSKPGVADTAAPANQTGAGTSGTPVQLATLAVSPDITDNSTISEQAQEQKADESAVSAVASNASASEAKYSIQVGMYVRVEYAEQLVETLRASSLDAYIHEFSNTKQEPRFNVRIGHYRDRDSAKAALNACRSQLAGDGYVIRVRH